MQRFFHAILILILFSSACATVGAAPEARLQNPSPGNDLRIISGVPFYPQEDYQCGPAALAAVLNFLGASVTPEEIGKGIYSPSAKGTLSIDMVLYAQGKGLEVSQYSGGLEDLRERIKSGRPLIVLVDYGFSVLRANHFMVVIGYNKDGVIAHSGGHERKFIPVGDFIKSWERTKYWTLLITK